MKRALSLIVLIGAIVFASSTFAASSAVTVNLNLPNIQFDPQTMEKIEYTWTTDQFAGGNWTSAGVIDENWARGSYSYVVYYLNGSTVEYSDSAEAGSSTSNFFELIQDSEGIVTDVQWSVWGTSTQIPSGELWSLGSGVLASGGLYGFWVGGCLMSFAEGDTSYSSSTATTSTSLSSGAVQTETVETNECDSNVTSWYTFYNQNGTEVSSVVRSWLTGVPFNGLKKVVTGTIQMPQ